MSRLQSTEDLSEFDQLLAAALAELELPRDWSLVGTGGSGKKGKGTIA